MAKKNGRDDPPKPQVAENEQMSDIILILDKMELILQAVSQIDKDWKSHATLTLLATQDLPTFGYNMIDPLKSWCWGSILFYPFKISRFS